MAKQELSVPKLTAMIPTEADAYLKLEELRWDGHPVCPHCGVKDQAWYIRPLNGSSRKTRTGAMSQRRVWKCGACRNQFSVLTGTIFQGSKIPLRTWLLVIFEMCASKNGVSAREIERKYELTAKTAWFMLHRIREAMKREPLAGLLRGTVMSDEAWVGGTPANRHRSDPREKTRLPGTTDKTPVMALIHYETREVRSRVIPTVDGDTLATWTSQPFAARNFDASLMFRAQRGQAECMETTQEIDMPDLRKTPNGWLAVAVDSPRIAVTAGTEDGALALFRERRAIWRRLIAQAAEDRAKEGNPADAW